MGKLAKLVGPQATEEAASQTPAAPQAGPTPSDLDPRPDLAEDHRDWMAVLAEAWREVDEQGNRHLWGLLHGLRCGGARLELRQTKDGRPYYKLDYTSLLGTWTETELRQRWLEPHRDRIKAALDRGLAAKQAIETQLERFAG